MTIETGDSPPIAQAPYQVALKNHKWLKEELTKLEAAGIIEKCVSPWASPVVIVPKKTAPGQEPQKRLCIDYRALNRLLPSVINPLSNAKGVLTHVPLPKIEDLFGILNGTAVFSSLDCTSGYHHIGLTEESQPKSAFVTPLGKFKFNKVPFGLAQAPAYFQELMNRVLSGIPFAFAYLDDILVFSRTPEEHLRHLRKIFERLRKADLRLKMAKCDFFKKELQYLGHIVTKDGVSPMPDKLQAIQDLKRPTTPTEARSLLGLTNYYRRFIPHYATLVKPLSKLTRTKERFEWTPAAEAAFEELKRAMQRPPILVYPDPNKPYFLYTDASKYAWGAVLLQQHEPVDLEDETKQPTSENLQPNGSHRTKLTPHCSLSPTSVDSCMEPRRTGLPSGKRPTPSTEQSRS